MPALSDLHWMRPTPNERSVSSNMVSSITAPNLDGVSNPEYVRIMNSTRVGRSPVTFDVSRQLSRQIAQHLRIYSPESGKMPYVIPSLDWSDFSLKRDTFRKLE